MTLTFVGEGLPTRIAANRKESQTLLRFGPDFRSKGHEYGG
jgi:hypothetical protein